MKLGSIDMVQNEPHKVQSAKRKSNDQIPMTDSIMNECLRYFDGDELAARVWMDKYALKDRSGQLIERTPDDMHRRLAGEIARCEQKYHRSLEFEVIYDLLKEFRYLIPQGSVMAGLGNDEQYTSLSNCFVIGTNGNGDSYGAILMTDQEQVQLMKRRGGVGHDLSKIRPGGSVVQNCALTSAGIVPFMKRFSNSTQEVAQDGRRGALMLTLDVRHPEIENFINAKLDVSQINGANVSLRLTDDFLKAVESKGKYKLQYPVGSKNPAVLKLEDAGAIWKKIVHNAWKSAEPGLLFWDTITRESIPDCYERLGFGTVSTNPCGEVPLCPYDSCRLLAVNLLSYVSDPFTRNASFDFKLFKEHARYAQRIMDDIVDLEIERIDRIIRKIITDPQDLDVKQTELELWRKIKQKCVQGRRVGIGVTAEGDMLAALGYRYGSEQAIEHSVRVHRSLALAVYRSSVELARQRGSFDVYCAEKEKLNPFVLRLKEEDPRLYDQMVKYGRRNIALLTIAPTGSVSILSQTSSGIEPAFKVSYLRRRRRADTTNCDQKDQGQSQWEEHRVLHKPFLECLRVLGLVKGDWSGIANATLTDLLKQTPYYCSEAHDIDWVNKVRMQGAIQKWVDHSISVTVNLPEETGQDIVEDIFITAWKSGCKGVTIYREGSREGILVSKKDEIRASPNRAKQPGFVKRPRSLEAKIFRFLNEKEKWIAAVGLMDGKPYEIFTGSAENTFKIPVSIDKGWIIKHRTPSGQSRYDFQYLDARGHTINYEGLSRRFDPEYWNLAKLISGVLRHGMPIESVIKLVADLHLGDQSLNTWKNGVARALSKFVVNGTRVNGRTCVECGARAMVFQEGCRVCTACGYTKCE